jgi:CubicO group peptidase (beta-lactamase class C family)
MKRILYTLLLPALMLMIAGNLPAQISKQSQRSIDSVINGLMTRASIPAVSIAVAERGKLLYSHAYGYSDLENRIPATPRSVFRLASVSKPITAVAIMQLVEQGSIHLDSSVQTYLPAFPVQQWPVTIRQLLGHQSGIRHYNSVEEEYRIGSTRYKDLTEALTIFRDDTLRHKPGEQYTYTTFGYNLLGSVIEAVSGMTFDDYVKRNIFDRAGMTQTTMDRSSHIIPHRVRGYTVDSTGSIRNAIPIDPGYKFPGGGIVSTAEDMVKFADAVMDGRLIEFDTFRRMTVPGTTNAGTPTGYGLGWAIGMGAMNGAVLHKGGQQGATCVLLLLPETRRSVMLLTNLERAGGVAEAAYAISGFSVPSRKQ